MSDLVCRNRGAHHIRGRVLPPVKRVIRVRGYAGPWIVHHRRLVRDHYWFEVVNTRSGSVVYRADAFGWADAIRECTRAVGVARWAWVMDLKRKELT